MLCLFFVLADEMVQRINEAINHWHTRTCIRFLDIKSKQSNNFKTILQINYTDIALSCESYNVGYIQNTVVTTFLGSSCTEGTIVHELGHIIGFYHEHSRIDRDDHVFIDLSKIGDMVNNYRKMDNPQPNYYGVQYDLSSIMHYPDNGGTIVALDPKRSFLMGQRIGLSFLDIKLANLGYKCSGKKFSF